MKIFSNENVRIKVLPTQFHVEILKYFGFQKLYRVTMPLQIHFDGYIQLACLLLGVSRRVRRLGYLIVSYLSCE